jgi:hypothetical protein
VSGRLGQARQALARNGPASKRYLQQEPVRAGLALGNRKREVDAAYEVALRLPTGETDERAAEISEAASAQHPSKHTPEKQAKSDHSCRLPAIRRKGSSR